MRSTETAETSLRQWKMPQLVSRGTVGEILNGGGGKLSVSAGDPGEYRCEKPACG